MASKRRNTFHKNKKQETTEIVPLRKRIFTPLQTAPPRMTISRNRFGDDRTRTSLASLLGTVYGVLPRSDDRKTVSCKEADVIQELDITPSRDAEYWKSGRGLGESPWTSALSTGGDRSCLTPGLDVTTPNTTAEDGNWPKPVRTYELKAIEDRSRQEVSPKGGFSHSRLSFNLIGAGSLKLAGPSPFRLVAIFSGLRTTEPSGRTPSTVQSDSVSLSWDISSTGQLAGLCGTWSVASCSESVGRNRFRPIAVFSGAVRVVVRRARDDRKIYLFLEQLLRANRLY
ncbi:hypothetical protein AAG570_002636 [Ranatra chinensis]|uniref:Uncharacterized protein n=1 Tax=Ranatra chinensis TaxID=642074 RepID=A0ABD0YA76_9HEMI